MKDEIVSFKYDTPRRQVGLTLRLTNTPKMRGIRVPVMADPVAGPTVTYGEELPSGAELTSIKFLTKDEGWARVTFEHLDSIRVSRGEYEPYPSGWKPGDEIHWVYEVAPSAWLLERYEYEKKHYGRAYEFTGDVDEMLRDFTHYVFTFHDQFVEALAAGIWFETFDDSDDTNELNPTHPFRNLQRPTEPDLIEAHGLICEVWPNTRPIAEILEDAKLCSQKLLQIAPVLDGNTSVFWTLVVRVRDGKARSSLKPGLGKVRATFDGVAGLEQIRPHVESWLEEVKERRKQMGKD
jgi:hypothetical protein